MHQLGIAALNPELPGLDSTQFKAVVTLIWPYSSSARQFALLLAEPNFRLRRKKGQVRARFSGTSARAIAATGVGVGDEVTLSLRGAQFVQDGTVSTPGKSIDWELSYSQTVAIQISRTGAEIANLELVDVAPTPALRSPVRPSPAPAPSWSSPAFLKGLRLSDGPIFQAPYDPLPDDDDEGHDKKRRRKSYRDWTAWTYSARTPSPEKDGIDLIEDFERTEASPSRQPRLPRTPVSPAKHAGVVGQGVDVSGGKQRNEERQEQDEQVRDTTYDDLYAGPDKLPPADVPYAFGGDTEEETEVNTEEEDAAEVEPDAVSVSSTEANTEDLEDELPITVNDASEAVLATDEQDLLGENTENATGENVHIEVWQEDDGPRATSFTSAPSFGMPPPALHSLQTDFPAFVLPGALTPIGREPPSPTLQPMDSATLPLPSPFPGERVTDEASSYLDHISTQRQSVELEATEVIEEELPEEQLPDEASYIGETSFFSSLNSSKASALHPNHESAFTPVRFAFGMDGAGFSRPLALSSPVQQESQLDIDQNTAHHLELVETSHIVRLEDLSEAEKKSEIIELSSGSESELEESDDPKPENVEEEADNDENLANASDLDHDESEEELAAAIVKGLAADENSDDSDDAHDTDDEDVDKTASFARKSASPRIDTSSQILGDEGASPREPQTRNSEVGEAWIDEHELEISEPSGLHESQDTDSQSEAALLQTETEIFSDFVDMDFVPERSDEVTTSKDLMPTHSPSHDDMNGEIQPLDEEQVQETDQPESLLPSGEPDVDMEDVSSPFELLGVESAHPDIKMESIEGPSSISMTQSQTEAQDSPDELLITVPDEGDKIGELHTIAVPDTAPARNTRSRTKTTVSPVPEEIPGPQTRSTRSKASARSFARASLSPPPPRNRSTTSPSHTESQASPLKVHSQQEIPSPTRGMAPPAPSPRRSSRRHSSQRSVDSIPDVVSSQLDDPQPTQLTSQATPKPRGVAKNDPRKTKDQVTSPMKSHSPTSAVHVSPRNLRRTRHHVYDTSGEHQGPVEDLFDVDTLLSESEGESGQFQSSSPLSPSTKKANTIAGHSQPLNASAQPSINQQSLMDSNTLITPEATQQSTTTSQPGINHARHQQSLPMTPQLTQAISAGLRSSQSDADMEDIEETAKSSPITKSTPRRNVTTTDVASVSASPQSQRASPNPEETTSKQPEQPSIGLSTPLAYYTPLNQLIFFLNRSSQLHSSSNPDILALVTSATTPSVRATKGPKHWTTTLHITDLSSWPGTTTVNVFRPYATALPHADVGDVVLLRAFAVKSLNRHPMLRSDEDSGWCVWRYGKPVWGQKKGDGVFGEVRAREEVKGPGVERGEGEWREVARLRDWYAGVVKGELEGKVKTRSTDKDKVREDGQEGEQMEVEPEQEKEKESVGVRTRSKDKKAVGGDGGA